MLAIRNLLHLQWQIKRWSRTIKNDVLIKHCTCMWLWFRRFKSTSWVEFGNHRLYSIGYWIRTRVCRLFWSMFGDCIDWRNECNERYMYGMKSMKCGVKWRMKCVRFFNEGPPNSPIYHFVWRNFHWAVYISPSLYDSIQETSPKKLDTLKRKRNHSRKKSVTIQKKELRNRYIQQHFCWRPQK